MVRRKETITLEDPRALRALAHPARQRFISELFSGRVLTATEAAELVDLTPSAVSHHLRALEKWGLARRTTGTGDGRERPWEGTAKALKLQPRQGAGSQAAMHSVMSVIMDQFSRELDDFMAGAETDPWRGSYQGIQRGELWLTKDETRALVDVVQAEIERLSAGRTPTRHPKDARRTGYVWSLIPAGPVPG
jgi:DNA-binding transcriptional ArsR family regulator